MEHIAKTLKTLSDTNRIRIICLLKKKKMCVCELAYILGITQPSVSRHLKKLKQAGFIIEEQDSLWTNYLLKKPLSAPNAAFLQCLGTCVINDSTLRLDLKKARHINRQQLCCKRSE